MPADLVGYGAITADAARDLAKQCGTADLVILGSTGPGRTCSPGGTTDRPPDPSPNPGTTTGSVADPDRVPRGPYEPAIKQKQQFGAPPQTGYRPHNALVREIIARYRTCRFPAAPRPAEQCDLDHVIPVPEGRTTRENLVPICRHHHILKTHGGWILTKAGPGDGPDGTVRWTSPNGLTFFVPPPDQPGTEFDD